MAASVEASDSVVVLPASEAASDLPASLSVVPASAGGVVVPASGGWQTMNEMALLRLNPMKDAPPPSAASGGAPQT